MYVYKRRWLATLSIVLLVVGLAACGGLSDPPALTDEEVLAQPDYRIVPGDTIAISVWRSPELATKAPVRPDGKVSLPLAGEIRAAGKTPLDLSADIEEALLPYVQVPKVSVALEKFAGNDGRTVQVLGEVKTPTSMPYRPYVTVLDVIVAAGGLTEFADGNSAKLIRRSEKGDGETFRLKLDDLVVDGNLKRNARLRPGDIIVVPSSLL